LIRTLTIALALLLAAFAWPAGADELKFPPLTGRVVDEVGLLRPAERAKLTAELAAHEANSGQQVVVAIVKSLQGRPIEEYGYQLGRAWGIGQKGRDTGAILLVAPDERKVRIEVGYGLEGDLTDAAASTIINRLILPRFQRGDFAGGIAAGVDQILRTLGDDKAVEAVPGRPRGRADDRGSLGSIILSFIIFGVFLWIATRRRGGGGGGPMILPFIVGSSWGGGRSSWGGGGGGGGFSGGGGSFGGGGASGSW